MSTPLLTRSHDLKQLVDEGYEIEIRSGHLLLKEVPYVKDDGSIGRGNIISTLNIENEATAKPETHAAWFAGDTPCDEKGKPLCWPRRIEGGQTVAEGVVANFFLSRKPADGYPDYYVKMTTYEQLFSGHAQVVNPYVTARTFAIVESDDQESPFWYMDTASTRAEIMAISTKLAIDSVAMIGLGGTGSYILDLVAKTHVKTIHLFDGDTFGQHNAFRAPGAPDKEVFKRKLTKSEYFREVYSKMHKNIFAYGYIDESTLPKLRDTNFVFMAAGLYKYKNAVINELDRQSIPFIDVGMGVSEECGSLTGMLRATANTDQSRGLVSYAIDESEEGIAPDEYSSNIQIADLNAMNAVLAVIKWKKIMGFYIDTEYEYRSTYIIRDNFLENESQK